MVQKKIVYLKYRRFLVERHKYRRKAFYALFDGKAESGSVPIRRNNSKYVFYMVRKINVSYGKKIKITKAPVEGMPFKKMSMFFKYLPYYKDLEVLHAVDAMHIKKNVFDSTICLLKDVKGKTKDGLRSRWDLVNMGIRSDLHPVEHANGKIMLPAARGVDRCH